MKLLVTMIAAALLSASAVAADVAQKKSQEPTRQATGQSQSDKKPADIGVPEKKTADSAPEKPKPSEEMKKLARLIGGRWQVEEKYEVSALVPQGGEAKGTDMVHRGPGGLSIVSNYNSSGTLGENHGVGITTWSADEGIYRQFWVDNFDAPGQLWTGKWEGESLVFTYTQKLGDQQLHWKEIFSGFSNDSFTITFDVGQTESDLKRSMTFKFTRMARQSAGVRRHGTGMHARPVYDGWGGPRADATQH